MFGFGGKKPASTNPDPGWLAFIAMLSTLIAENDRLEGVIRECVVREQKLREEMLHYKAELILITGEA